MIVTNILYISVLLGQLNLLASERSQSTATLLEQTVRSLVECSHVCYLHPTCRGVGVSNTGSSMTSYREQYTCRLYTTINSEDFVIDENSEMYEMIYL